MQKNKIDFESISKMLALFGMVIFVTYFMIRIYAVSQGLDREFYGVGLFNPDRIWQVILVTSVMMILGILLYFLNKRKIEEKN
jgi:hypothetical protein